MMSDSKLDARKWQFLNKPGEYLKQESGGLKLGPLERQFKTAKKILTRLQRGSGVLLADDVGFGKTTVGALVAWVFACQGKKVRIYAPNKVLQRRWAEELERHVPMLAERGASHDLIKQGDVGKLNEGRIQVTTHYSLVKSHKEKKQQTSCDLMIIDEAHRAKGEQSRFKTALDVLGNRAKRKLILTATPFSIDIGELVRMLQFVSANKEFEAVRRYAEELKRLYSLGDGHDVVTESERLVDAAGAAIDELQQYLIRHSIDDLSDSDRKHFGEVAEEEKRWVIPPSSATEEDIALLLRIDRILQLTPERNGERRNDPRFHIGWQHLEVELNRVGERASDSSDPTLSRHIKAAAKDLRTRRTKPHPKIAAVIVAMRPLLDRGEKVLVFCHHRATASELLAELERSLKDTNLSPIGPPKKVWRAAWESLSFDWHSLGLSSEKNSRKREEKQKQNRRLISPIIDWLCSLGMRRQISGWLGEPALTTDSLAAQLSKTRPRNAKSSVPTILESARTLTEVLLDQQSTSTRAVLRNMTHSQGARSHFPGQMDVGYRTMGFWTDLEEYGKAPKTLYIGTKEPDIVLALFNSPFGPDVLVTTDRLSEGVDLHRCCRHLIHYELDPSPIRTIQRNGRIRRVGSRAALTGQPIQYAYPTFGGTRDEKAVAVMRQRINAFGLLLGGVPSLDDEEIGSNQNFTEKVLCSARKELANLNRKLCV